MVRRWCVVLLVALTYGGCAIGYHGRVGSAEQKPHAASVQFLYADKFLAGLTVAGAEVRADVASEGRDDARYGLPFGVRVVDTAIEEDDVEGRIEVWPYAGWIRDGGAHGFDVGLHARYQRLGYFVCGVQRTFGTHADTQGFLGFGVEVGRLLF